MTILQKIDPLWATCSADMRGEYDPPYALSQAPFAAVPTSSSPFPSQIPATPASSPKEKQPSQTPKPVIFPSSHERTSPLLFNDPSKTEPSANEPPAHDPPGHDPPLINPTPNEPTAKDYDPSVRTATHNIPPAPGLSPTAFEEATADTANDPAMDELPASVADPAAIMSIVIGIGSSNPESHPAGGHIAAATGDQRNSMSPEAQSNPKDPENGIGEVVASINGEDDSTAYVASAIFNVFSSGSFDPSSLEQTSIYIDGRGHKHTVIGATDKKNTAIIDGSLTLTVSGPAASLNRETLSLAPHGLVVDGSTLTVSSSSDPVEGKIMYIDASGQIHTAIEAGGERDSIVIDGSVTLRVGGRGTVLNGDTLSLAPAGLVVDGTTKAFATAAVPSDSSSAFSTLGVGISASAVNAVQTGKSSEAGRYRLFGVRGLALVLSSMIVLVIDV